MPIRPVGVPKPTVPAAPVDPALPPQSVTTGSDGKGMVTFPADVVASSVQATAVDAAGTGVVVNVESVVGPVVRVRSYRAATLFAGGPAVVNVTGRRVTT